MRNKKLWAMFLSICMTLGVTACGNTPNTGTESKGSTAEENSQVQESTVQSSTVEESESNIPADCPDYVNMESAVPFVKEDSGEEVTLTMWVAAQDGAKDVEDTWLWTYLQDVGNVKLEITLIPWSSKGEKKNLALSTGDLPDIMYNMQLSTTDMVTYGQEEHILADMSTLIEDYAPNLNALLEANPTHKAAWTTPDGGIYSASLVKNEITVSGGYEMYVNQDWLDEAGITELPTTLDEFTDMLRAFKALHEGDDNYVPLGGYWGADCPTQVILQALGLGINSFRSEVIGNKVIKNDGTVSIIYADDLYAEYLKIANQWYEEGLISQDYFTIDWKTTRAQAGESLCGAYPQYGMDTMLSFVKDSSGNLTADEAVLDEYMEKWIPLSPMTSEWNDTPVVPKGDGATIGNFVIAESCENKEVAMRLLDWFYSTENSVLAKWGPMKDGEVSTYDLTDGWSISKDAEGNLVETNLREIGQELNIYSGYYAIGGEGDNLVMPDTGMTIIEYRYAMAGYEGQAPERGAFNLSDRSGRLKAKAEAALRPYAAAAFPSVLYLDQETATRVSDISAVVSNYATTETAKFITGERPIEEADDYLAEIRAMGADELIEIYKQAYQDYLANMQ